METSTTVYGTSLKIQFKISRGNNSIRDGASSKSSPRMKLELCVIVEFIYLGNMPCKIITLSDLR